ncbi:MAG: hypothetical protein SF066_04395 [Thermoanaerobaculia bacterium]|nr:hypothetical protein [Thermoanaerobaculia bacterium]
MRARNLILAVTLPLATFAPALHAAPAVTFEAQAVIVSGLAPGAEIVYFSVAREVTTYAANVVRREGRVKDDDLDGSVRIAVDPAVPWRSIWVVVDLATGLVVPATPEGYPLRDAEARGGFALAPTGAFTHLGAAGDLSHVLVVRPGTGAWVATLTDGAASDEDGGGNRTIVSALDVLEPVAAGPPPPLELLPGDRVIEIDSDAMAWALETVGGAP